MIPKEMELSTENNKKASFPDLQKAIIKMSLGPYDENDTFPLSIARMAYKASNIPSAIFYCLIGMEIPWMVRTISVRLNFVILRKLPWKECRISEPFEQICLMGFYVN